MCFGILFPKGELQKFHRPSRQIAPESLPVSGNVFLPKKKSFDSQAKKSQYMYIMWQIIARIAKGNNFIFQIKKYCVSTNFTVFKITKLNFHQEENISGHWNS